jgi:hypothetical protein
MFKHTKVNFSVTLLSALMIIAALYSSCKKTEEVIPPTKTVLIDANPAIRSVSIDLNGVATIKTHNGQEFTRMLKLESRDGKSLGYLAKPNSGDPKSMFNLESQKLKTATVGPEHDGIGASTTLDTGWDWATFTATVRKVGPALATVTLDSYAKQQNEWTVLPTVYGVICYAREVDFFIEFVWLKNGVYFNTTNAEYFAHL